MSKLSASAKLSSRWSALDWLLLSQAMVVVTLLAYQPSWLIAYGFAAIAFKYVTALGYVRLSNRLNSLIKMLGFLIGLAGLYLTYDSLLGLDVGMGFLLLCLVSKILETTTRRDAYIVLNLSLFVLAGVFLLDQSLTTSISVFIVTHLVLFALISQNDGVVTQSADDTDASQLPNANVLNRPTGLSQKRVRTLALLTIQAIPLLVTLFIFFPRLPPLWSVNLSGGNATTGMSDTMSPGDISELSQSTELAFRATFDNNEFPPRQDLYWRGLTLETFDGLTWTRGTRYDRYFYNTRQLASATQFGDEMQPYQIIMEATNQPWTFTLPISIPDSQKTSTELYLTQQYALQSMMPIVQQSLFSMQWYPKSILDTKLSPQARRRNLRIPTQQNLSSQLFAQQLFERVNRDPIAYADAIMRWIRQQNFSYTLSPPLLGDERIDDFLFNTRAGFCEHYSSSFTYLMRAAGVPARVVVGYMGGALGRDGKSWEVRQSDAHAWSEIWVAGRGWIRYDPTAAIAPERINQSFESLAQSRGASFFGDGLAGSMKFQQYQTLLKLRRVMDQASYYWQEEVVGYDEDQQSDSLLSWFNITSIYQQVLYMSIGFSIMVAGIVIWLFYKRRKVWHPADRAVIRLSKRLKKTPLKRQDSEGVLAWLQRIQPYAKQPERIQEFSNLYRQIRYQDSALNTNKTPPSALNHLDRLSKRLKFSESLH